MSLELVDTRLCYCPAAAYDQTRLLSTVQNCPDDAMARIDGGSTCPAVKITILKATYALP